MGKALELFKIKQGDRRKYIFGTLTPLTASGQLSQIPDSMVGATVVFNMRTKAGVAVLIERPCVIDDAAVGEVHYEWSAGETDVPGKYFGEFQAIFPGDERATYPNDKIGFTIIITPQIA